MEKLYAKIDQLVAERDCLAQAPVDSLGSISVEQRRGLIKLERGQLSNVRQCDLVSISRPSFRHRSKAPARAGNGRNPASIRVIDVQSLEIPWCFFRQMMRPVRQYGHAFGRKRVWRPMAKMGLAPIYL